MQMHQQDTTIIHSKDNKNTTNSTRCSRTKLNFFLSCMTFFLSVIVRSNSIVSHAFMSRYTLHAVAATAASGSTTTTTAHTASSTTLTGTESTTSSTTNNPLLQMSLELPPFSVIQPNHITPAVQTLLTQLKDDFAALESKISSCDVASTTTQPTTPTTLYDDVVPTLERLSHPLASVWGVVGHLQGVLNSDELRAAHDENQAHVVQAMSALSQSKTLYQALQTIQSQTDTTDEPTTTVPPLDQAQRRAVAIALRGMTLGGVGLEGAQQERFNIIKQRLAALSSSFSNHVLDATKAYSLTIDDPARLQGAPATALAMWAASAAAASAAAGPTDSDSTTAALTDASAAGPWRITLDGPSYMAVLQHVADRDIREQVYRAYITRASEIDTDHSDRNNIPLIYEILTLKHEMANLLGFDNYASLSLASKMAPSIASVTELSELIRTTALPAARAEWDEITNYSSTLTNGEISTLKPWDVSYFSERLKESKFSLTEEETRPYFALPEVLKGMFSLVERLFGIVVEAADGEAQVWHPDVRFFKVYSGTADSNDQRQHIASFFLDPYARPETKRGGAWMDVCTGKSNAVPCDIPVAYLTCNGSPPVGTVQPSLMTFREVETLFHEFGHGLQHMLTTVTVGDVAGINGVEWDAVELPSQFMENWCYDRPTVYGFAKHWETGAPMPEDMFEKLKLQKTYNAGMMSCRQLQFGQLDMELHSGFDAAKGASGEGESIFDVHQRIAAEYSPYNMPMDQDRFLCAFAHIFAGGYAAGYYSYKWAEVMSADAFSAFEDVGLENEEKVQEVGRRFRETVLSLGGGEDPMTVFRAFRGREPRPEALLRHNGLA